MSEVRDPETDQQLPEKNGYPVIQELIIAEAMEESLVVGVRKYGTGLQPYNGRDPLLDLEQELRDALVYARQLRWERDNPPVTGVSDVELMELVSGLLQKGTCNSMDPVDRDRWSMERAYALTELQRRAES